MAKQNYLLIPTVSHKRQDLPYMVTGHGTQTENPLFHGLKMLKENQLFHCENYTIREDLIALTKRLCHVLYQTKNIPFVRLKTLGIKICIIGDYRNYESLCLRTQDLQGQDWYSNDHYNGSPTLLSPITSDRLEPLRL